MLGTSTSFRVVLSTENELGILLVCRVRYIESPHSEGTCLYDPEDPTHSCCNPRIREDKQRSSQPICRVAMVTSPHLSLMIKFQINCEFASHYYLPWIRFFCRPHSPTWAFLYLYGLDAQVFHDPAHRGSNLAFSCYNSFATACKGKNKITGWR